MDVLPDSECAGGAQEGDEVVKDAESDKDRSAFDKLADCIKKGEVQQMEEALREMTEGGFV